MTDRLTQLQDAVNQLGEYFCNSVGVLQSSDQAPLGGQQPNETKDTSEDNTALFSSLIARTAQDIEILINSLPNQDSSDHQDDLCKLEAENRQAALKLRQAVDEGEHLLKKIREALEEISNSQLAIDGTVKS